MLKNIGHVWCEIKAAGSIKAKLVILLFRLSTIYQSSNALLKIISVPFVVLNKVINEWLFCVEIPHRTQIGFGLKIYHPHCIVVNSDVIIGTNCTLRQGVTIGSVINCEGHVTKSPVLGNQVELGANAILLGDITLGDNVKVGAGTVVTKSLAAGKVVVGYGTRELN
ncbi:serine acetyltransferase [Pectobacterium carotovorum]|uniref:serine acetyltransferase n=1 Tax=Pectobacterium carotovorum TaxID=554 RepID=UPI0001A43DB9|nr:serine acetyltransferase [Pectobacterium carotovorum]KHT27084.1 colanic acid biosynthesis acetyltransferase [Pectobacterium carotovorum subsp. carotovorum]KHT32309.1 colanic acid biosynthesis acetyltransferase [Pectobacterium carotovorum subsp. carotovorum]MBL0907982.1 serine acetyltransferase [Pectobacterium carotovorum]MDK9421542.1 serine acetyltransferase [Pectobacterium carotovorum]QHP57312.1 serine acetyltransferase [Pectobacterium carotovorum subsp. carotovorum]